MNYGRIEDFKWLKETKNLELSGKICIARYGKIFRGDKVVYMHRLCYSLFVTYMYTVGVKLSSMFRLN